MNKILIAGLLAPVALFAGVAPSQVAESAVAVSAAPVDRIGDEVRSAAGWRVLRGAVPVWPEAVPFPAWNNPELVELQKFGALEATVRRVADLKAQGRTVLVAWSPLAGELPPSPEALADAVSRIAALADGFAPAWHRTGAHYAAPNPGVAAFLAAAARRGNPRVAIFGEAYFGETPEADNALAVFAPPGCSGVLLVNAARPTAVTGNLVAETHRRSGIPTVLAVLAGQEEEYRGFSPRLVLEFDPENN